MAPTSGSTAVNGLEHKDLEQAYGELKKRYENLVDRSLAGVFRTTVEGSIMECNDALARILGYQDAQEVMRNPALDLYFSQQDRDRFVEDLLDKGQLTNYEIALRHRNGRPVHVLENVFLESTPNGPGSIYGTLIDVTSYRQSELEQRSLMASYRNLVEHIRDGLLVLVDGEIKYANPAAEDLIGDSLVGTSFVDRLDPDDGERLAALLQEATRSGQAGPLQIDFMDSPLGEAMLLATTTTHEGVPAVQVTIQDQRAQQNLIKDRLRLQIAEEVNAVLRKEITEHRHTQEALRRSRRFARSLIDSSLDMIMAADHEGRITEFNPAASMRFGWEAEEVLGNSSRMLYADHEQYERIQEELDTHGVFAGEITNVTKFGEDFTTYLAASKLYDEDGRLIGAMGVSRDITRMKQDQEALKASEERYRDLFENATDLIQSVDRNGRFEYVNTAWKQVLGYPDVEWSELHFEDIIAPEHLEHCRAIFDRILKGEDVGRIETVFKARDGRRILVEGTSTVRTVEGTPVATRSIFHDVTLVRKAREKLLEHEAKLRALFESSEHMFWTVDPSIKLTSYNRGYAQMIERLHGKHPEVNTDPGRPRRLFADPAYHAFWEAKYAEAIAGRPIRFETDLLDKRGGRVCNEIFLSPVFASDGNVKEVFGIGHEITEQKQAQDLVRAQAVRLKGVFENAANVMIWTLDKDFRITSFNDHFRDSVEAELGIRFSHGDDFVGLMRQRAARNLDGTLAAKYHAALKGKPQQFEAELRGLRDRRVWVETFLNPIKTDGQVTEISCMGYGITDRKEAQMRLLQSLNEKEVLLKEVHHRVKNNLQVISSILSLQTAHVGNDKRILDLLRDSRDRIRSMSFIHESLYQTKDFSSIDLANYIEGLSRNLMMSYSLTGKIALDTDLQRTDLVLDQAIPCGLILNELISNALKHAFPDHREGTVHIGLHMVQDQVHITVRDNGVGVQEGFDVQRDGNLGLELVHTLVEQLDGRIELSTGNGVAYLLTFERHK
ncbi:MAG: PAS domain S-box protein [Flavobacteriales bacterium]